jgi:ABC-2 type transport system permease protein
MMRYLRLVGRFVSVAFQDVMAYRLNFWIRLLRSVLNLVTGVLGVVVLYGQVETIRGWDRPAALSLLGVYLVLNALYYLFIGPSLESLAGMDGEVWTGKFDFTLLRPIDVQFLASVRYWRPTALLDLAFGLGVLGTAIAQLGSAITFERVGLFLLTLLAGIAILYAILLAMTALVLWSPGFLFTWLFSALFQMARYPTGLYPGWLRLILTWVVPVGVMTTIPAQALAGTLSTGSLIGALVLAVGLFLGASLLFRLGLRRYASASS